MMSREHRRLYMVPKNLASDRPERYRASEPLDASRPSNASRPSRSCQSWRGPLGAHVAELPRMQGLVVSGGVQPHRSDAQEERPNRCGRWSS